MRDYPQFDLDPNPIPIPNPNPNPNPNPDQVRDYPQFDPTVGMLNVEETHEEVEIELNEEEPIFLR